MQKHKFAIAANFTAEPIQDCLEHFIDELGLEVDVEFGPYNQVFQLLMAQAGLLRNNGQGINTILLRLEDWGKSADTHGQVAQHSFDLDGIRRNVGDFIEVVKSAADASSVPYIVCVCHPSQAAARDVETSRCLVGLERSLEAELGKVSNLHLITTEEIAALYPVEEYDDPVSNRLGHVPYTAEYYAAVGAVIARKAFTIKSSPYKVIVLDCDQTLWKGVCGEVGPLGVEIDDARRSLQEFMVAQHDAGMLLALCSKNNEEDVHQVFEQQPQMPLRLEHIVATRINWNNKSANIKALANELNLGLDSFIFVDDDPVVCAEVRANCPEVLALQLPQDTGQIPRFLRHVWAFDRLKTTSEDKKRTELYRQNLERERVLQGADNFDDFLRNLELKIEIREMTRQDIPRVSQLTQRTNQFNFTTIRRTESEIEQLYQRGNSECLVVEVSDRFGDYGLVGVIIFQMAEDSIKLDTFLLSCRALGRGVEHRMMACVGQMAVERNLSKVEVLLIPSKKNSPALEFMNAVGADHRNASMNDLAFVLPSGYAANLKFEPGDKTSSGFEQTSGDKVPAYHTAAPVSSQKPINSKTEGLNRIANELYDASRILKTIRAKERLRTTPVSDYAEPQNEVERKLAEIWSDVLSIQKVGANDNFFELGGDSLLGVSLFVEIERALGKELQMSALFQAPTVRQLAALFENGNGKPKWSSLVPIRPEGKRLPFYCIHAAGGHVIFYRDLAKYLDPEQPVYGLQARGLDKTQVHHDCVEDMAAYYIQEIRTLQPEGPYHLGGSSFGGLVAFEMARQLHQQRQEVGLLALFDTYGPGYPQITYGANSIKAKLHNYREKVQRVKDTLQALDHKSKVNYLVGRAAKARMMIKRKILWKKNEFELKFNSATGKALPKDLQRNHKAIQHALKTYVPREYQGRMVLFRTSHQPYGAKPDASLGWSGLVKGGIEIHEVPGSHGAVTVDPYAKPLAEKLNLCLAMALR